jgi:hypothetical protein
MVDWDCEFLQLGNIRAMHAFVMKHGKDYLNKNRSTEQDRDKIENEVKSVPHLWTLSIALCSLLDS